MKQRRKYFENQKLGLVYTRVSYFGNLRQALLEKEFRKINTERNFSIYTKILSRSIGASIYYHGYCRNDKDKNAILLMTDFEKKRSLEELSFETTVLIADLGLVVEPEGILDFQTIIERLKNI